MVGGLSGTRCPLHSRGLRPAGMFSLRAGRERHLRTHGFGSDSEQSLLEAGG